MKKKNRTRPKKAEGAVPQKSQSRNWILGIILGVTFLTFANTLANEFAYDDQTFILQNQIVQSSSLGEAVAKLPVVLTRELWFYRVLQDKDPNKDAGPTTPYYRPTFAIFQMACWLLFHANPVGWHFMNILIHLLAVYFVFLIFERITNDLKLSAIASLLFAVHPLRAESVAWICGVSDPFLAIFLLPSFYLYLRYRDDGRGALLASALALFLFAAFTKEPAVAFPIFIAVYELFVINRGKSAREKIIPAFKYSVCFLLVSAFYFSARYYALGFALNNSNFKYYPVHQVLLTIPLVIWKYIGLMLWPFGLSLFHATYMVKSPLDMRFILPLVALIALACGLWRLRGSMTARFAILWFAVNLLPVLNLSAFSEDFLVQERYVYIPSIGFSLLAAMAIAKLPIEKWLPLGSRAAAQATLVGALVLFLAGKSLAQNTVWKDDMTLWSYGAEEASDQLMSRYILGHKLINFGEYRKASEQLEEYLKLSPDNLIVMSNLASAHVIIYQSEAGANALSADRSHLDRAVELCEKGLSREPNSSPFWDTLGQVYTFETGLKNYDRAISCFQRALTLSPGNAMMTFHLGGTLAKKGDLDTGMQLLRAAVDKDPNLSDAHKFLGYSYRAKGQLKEAIDELDTYLRLHPNAADAPKVSKDVQDFRALLQTLTPQS